MGCDVIDHTKCELGTNIYVRAFYFVITVMSTVGYGDIRPYTILETCFNLIVILTGAIFFAAIIGAFQAYYQSLDQTGAIAFMEKMKRISIYMEYRDLPPRLRSSIMYYFKGVWKRNHGLEVAELIRELPKPLQTDIAAYIRASAMQTITAFHDCSIETQKRFTLVMQPFSCCPKDVIYEDGNVDQCVYFLINGNVRITKTQNGVNEHETVSTGDHFGQAVIDDQDPAKVYVRRERAAATSFCEMFLVQKEDFFQVLALLPMKQHTTVYKAFAKSKTEDMNVEEEFKKQGVDVGLQWLSSMHNKTSKVKAESQDSSGDDAAKEAGGDSSGDGAETAAGATTKGPKGRSRKASITGSMQQGLIAILPEQLLQASKKREGATLILRDPVACGFLRSFTQKEFNSENLLFALAVVDYKRSCHESDNENVRRHHANLIWNSYCCADSKYEISLDSKTMDITTENMKAPDENCFDAAFLKATQTIEKDVLVGFLAISVGDRNNSLQQLPCLLTPWYLTSTSPRTHTRTYAPHAFPFRLNSRDTSRASSSRPGKACKRKRSRSLPTFRQTDSLRNTSRSFK